MLLIELYRRSPLQWLIHAMIARRASTLVLKRTRLTISRFSVDQKLSALSGTNQYVQMTGRCRMSQKVLGSRGTREVDPKAFRKLRIRIPHLRSPTVRWYMPSDLPTIKGLVHKQHNFHIWIVDYLLPRPTYE